MSFPFRIAFLATATTLIVASSQAIAEERLYKVVNADDTKQFFFFVCQKQPPEPLSLTWFRQTCEDTSAASIDRDRPFEIHSWSRGMT